MKLRTRPATATKVGGRRCRPVHAYAFAVFWIVLSAAGLAPAADQPSPESDQTRILTPNASVFDSLSRFTQVLDVLQKNYIQPSRVSTGQHTTVALRAFVRSVDPEADLLTPDEVAATNAGARADIGLSFASRDTYPVILSARDESPAQDAGLLHGEQLIAIDNQPLLHARRIDVQQLLRGPVNSPVTLSVRDPSTGTVRDVHVQRTTRGSSSGVVLKFLNRVAYCRVPEFSHATVEALHTAMVRAKEERAAGVILDLRNNAGGAFDAMQVAASLFLPANVPVVGLEYPDPSQRTIFVSDQSEKSTVPLVILVNGGTAAEAEMFAAALQDHKRAPVVGSRTFGRGLLTTSIPLSDGSALVLPTAYYLRPSNQIVHGTGVTPDIPVDLPRETEHLLARLGFSTFNWKNDKNAVLKTDLQLARAISLLSK
jgi:carboxyl-terminal processing protease